MDRLCYPLLSLLVIVAVPTILHCQTESNCDDFNRQVQTTYNFKPSQLKTEVARNDKSVAMDRFWESVKSNRVQLLPCLRQALDDPKADLWFRFDGSNLLLSLDTSKAAKQALIRNYAAVDLDDVDRRVWLSTLTRLAVEGLDISPAGERWLSHPSPRYSLPEHGDYEVKKFDGALFMFGSMDEALATPALVKIASQVNHPGREVAVQLLMLLATPESDRALNNLDFAGFPPATRDTVRAQLRNPQLITPRSKPMNTRAEFISALEAYLNNDSKPFFALVDKVPDGERDLVATLTSQDLPIVRKVRRKMIAAGNQHAIEFYDVFTQIVRTMMQKGATAQNVR